MKKMFIISELILRPRTQPVRTWRRSRGIRRRRREIYWKHLDYEAL
jgi:hypothetical protein